MFEILRSRNYGIFRRVRVRALASLHWVQPGSPAGLVSRKVVMRVYAFALGQCLTLTCAPWEDFRPGEQVGITQLLPHLPFEVIEDADL